MAFSITDLFRAARENLANPMNQPGRLTGKHCVARLQRAQAKRQRLNRGHGRIVSREPLHPAFCERAGGAA